MWNYKFPPFMKIDVINFQIINFQIIKLFYNY